MQAVVMPKLGLTMTEGAIADWLKQPGDAVTVGEAIAEIETEKITYTLQATVEGTLLKVLLPAGESAPVMETIAWIGQPGEEIPELTAAALATATTTQFPDEQLPITLPAGTERSALATPLAKRIARESSVDIGRVLGTGPNRRIQSTDVEDFLRRLEARPLVMPDSVVTTDQADTDAVVLSTGGERVRRIADENDEDRLHPRRSRLVPHSSMRKAIAKGVAESWSTIPHVTLQRNVVVTGMMDLQQRASDQQGKNVSLTAVIACLVSRVLPRHPVLNAHYEQNGCRIFDDVHLGIAISVPHGLVVPVIQNANSKSIPELADEIGRLSECARSGTLKSSEMQGGTFTVSSLGMYGIDGFTPIIVSPQTAILGIGRVVKSVQAYGEETSSVASMVLSLSFDHRAVDGVYGAQFMESLARCFEDPLRILL